MRDGSSVAVDLARWRGAFVIGFMGLFLIKLMLAATLSPFGDEAFYWQESHHLAWGYCDLPPLTACWSGWIFSMGAAHRFPGRPRADRITSGCPS